MTEVPKRAPTTRAGAFQRGQEDARIKSFPDGVFRAILVGAAITAGVFFPVAWYWKIVIFLAIMFLAGVIIAVVRSRRERLAHRSAKADAMYHHSMSSAIFSGSEQRFDDDAKETLIDAVSTMLLAQHVTTGTHTVEDDSGNINRPALGYIFGFVQAGIANLGGNPLDAFVGAPVMLKILKRLYPSHEHHYLDFIMRNLETDEAMNDGARYGGQQYLDYIVHNHPSGGQPEGFARCLLGAATPSRQHSSQ